MVLRVHQAILALATASVLHVGVVSVAVGAPLATFELKEWFGVSHPDQVVELPSSIPLDPQADYHVQDASGRPYLAQASADGRRLCVRLTTGLAANETKRLELYARQPAQALDRPIEIREADPTYIEIANGLTGVRIVKPIPLGSYALAPIQGIQLRDGRWTAVGPNRLWRADASPKTPLSATNASMRILERGPVRVVVELTYRFARPAWAYPGHCREHRPPDCLYRPEGEGFYTCTITLESGQPSILIEDHTDMELRYELDVFDPVHPNQGRYRGHHATSAAAGYEVDGRVYRPAHQRLAMDAFRDLVGEQPLKDAVSTGPAAELGYIPRMSAWNPWATDTGWYWMLYDKDGGGQAPVIGVFMGPASRALGANVSGPGLFYEPQPDGNKRVGVAFETRHRGPDNRFAFEHRIAWGIFVGSQESDLRAPDQVQPIAHQMNLHGGINLSKLANWQLEFDDTGHTYGSLYIEPEVIQRMIHRLRDDRKGPHGDGYYAYLYAAEPSARPLLELWADGSGEKLRAAALEVQTLARELLDRLVNGDGIYDPRYHYWLGGVEMQRKSLLIDAMLADPKLPELDPDGSLRRQLKTIAALFAYLLHDNDFVPIDNHDTNLLPLGTANMPVQWTGFRNTFLALMPEHPLFAGRADQVVASVSRMVDRLINDSGAEISNPHYIEASFFPVLNNLLQVRMAARSQGGDDPFAVLPKLAKFAAFYPQLLTPPEPRFGGWRKIVASGDGATEGSALPGVLATGFRSADPGLAARLMGTWEQMGRVHSGFYGSTLLMIDEDFPSNDPQLGSANFPGYMSVLRSGWGQTNESAVWLFNGDFQSDHRNDDRGSMVIYAWRAPLSINFGSMYSPHLASGVMKNLLMPESAFPGWRQPNPPVDQWFSGWQTSTNTRFHAFRYSAFTDGLMTGLGGQWHREVWMIHAVPSLPVILVRDQPGQTNNANVHVLTWNFMAQGPVQTPRGPITPEPRLSRTKDTAPDALPSVSEVIPLQAGVNRFEFTGQLWPKHETQGIDWQVYVRLEHDGEAVIGNWGHAWHPTAEQAQFAEANGRPFEERQHILRVGARGSIETLILPWPKGQAPADLQVERANDTWIITFRGGRLEIHPQFYAAQTGSRKVLTTLGAAPGRGFDLLIQGGPTELIIEGGQTHLFMPDSPGPRHLTRLSGAPVMRFEVPETKLPVSFREILVDYAGDKPVQVVLE